MRGVIVTVACVLFGLSGDEPPPKPSTVEWIPDPKYHPARGDHAVIYGYRTDADRTVTIYGSTHSFIYEEYWKALAIGDDAGIIELHERKYLVKIPPKTGVLILETEDYPEDDDRANSATVRIMDGPLKGEKFWVPEFSVCRLIANPAYKPPGEPKTPEEEPEPSPEERKRTEEAARKQTAASYLNIAENLRRSKKYTQARKVYDEIIRDFSDQPEAGKAKERLKTLPKD